VEHALPIQGEVTNRAALYLRSSKDRSDVSIDAQRRALQELAITKGLVVVTEYADAVESGKDEDRPGFQSLLRELNAVDRGWEHVLVLDTSRVARRREIAHFFERALKRAGVQLHFKNVPDTDPITSMLLTAILQAMDEWHSLTSKAKGLAGMAENVRQGWRAGGKAPRGYELEYHSTGAIREGQPVLKSKLRPSDEAPLVATYLRARAAGRPRGALIAQLQLPWTSGSLNDLEWMALTYAGHTVWGATNELTGDGYVNGTKRKPRAQWTIQRNTHEPLITDLEADSIIDQLERGRTCGAAAASGPTCSPASCSRPTAVLGAASGTRRWTPASTASARGSGSPRAASTARCSSSCTRTWPATRRRSSCCRPCARSRPSPSTARRSRPPRSA
jgi:site-specific DNA recombinase